MADKAKVGDYVESLVDYHEIKKGAVMMVDELMSDGAGVHARYGEDEYDTGCLYHSEYTIVPNPHDTSVSVDDIEQAVEDMSGIVDLPPPTLPDLGKMMGMGPSIDSVTEVEALHTHPSGALREPKDGKGKPHLLLCSFPYALQQLSLHVDCELGRERNFEKGLPMSSFVDAALRHLTLWTCGDPEPHHMRSALWNIIALMETEHRVETGYLPESIDDIQRDQRSEVKYAN